MEGCHVCECPEPKGIEEVKARILFIANMERGSPMWEHVVGHIRDAKKGKTKKASLYVGELPKL